MRNRRKFYKERPHYIKPNDLESVGEVAVDRKIYVNDENITFSLVYHEGQTPTNVGECYKEISLPIQVKTRTRKKKDNRSSSYYCNFRSILSFHHPWLPTV